MKSPLESERIGRLTRWYQRFLWIYPARFRQEYGPEMVRLFRDQCRHAETAGGNRALVNLFISTLADLLASSIQEHIMEGNKPMTIHTPRLSFARIFWTVFLLAVAGVSVAVWTWPKSYASMVRLQVNPAPATIMGRENVEIADPYFLQTELHLIQSKTVLQEVVQQLNLTERWSKAAGKKLSQPVVVERLKRSLRLRLLANSRLVEIRAFTADPWEAPVIAGKVAEVYAATRSNQRVKRSVQALEQLDVELARATQQVGFLQEHVEKLRARHGITGAWTDPERVDNGSVRKLEDIRSEAKSEYVTLSSTLQSLKNMAPDTLRKVAPVVYPDARVTELLKEFDAAEQKLSQVVLEFSADHPQTKRAVGLREEIDRQIRNVLSEILAGLEIRAESMKARLQTLEQEINGLQAQQAAQRQGYAEYYAARQDLQTQEGIRTALLLRINQEKIDGNAQRDPVVEIIDAPEIAQMPVRPNVPLSLLAGTAGSLVLAAGMGFAFSRRRLQPEATDLAV